MANEITPATRWEKLLSEVLGEEYAVIPVTRIEKFLANILGEEYDLIPVTRIEKLLAKIAEEGGGGSVDMTALFEGLIPDNETITVTLDRVRSGVIAGRRNPVNLTVTVTGGAIEQDGIIYNSNLEILHLISYDNTLAFAQDSCRSNPRLSVIVAESNSATFASYALRVINSALKTFDCKGSGGFTNATFWNDSGLKTLVLRQNSVNTLGNTNCFQGTPFASNGSGGTLYVPQAQITAYQAAKNWSTILGYANNQILPIEGSIYETKYADGTPIT